MKSTIYRTMMLKGICIQSGTVPTILFFSRLAFILMFKGLSFNVKHLKRSVNEFYRLPFSVFHDGLERRKTAHVNTERFCSYKKNKKGVLS